MRMMSLKMKLLTYLSPLWFGLILFFLLETLNPLSSGPGGVLAVFVMIYLFTASVLFIVLHVGVGFVSKLLLKRKRIVTARGYRIGIKRAYYIASVVAFGPVLLLALNSVRQLRLVDVLLVVLFLVLAIFYFSKRDI